MDPISEAEVGRLPMPKETERHMEMTVLRCMRKAEVQLYGIPANFSAIFSKRFRMKRKYSKLLSIKLRNCDN